jgi:hypothetical protein
MQLDMRLNRDGESRYDCFFLAMAQQKSVAGRGPEGVTPASFDWEHKVTVKLGVLEAGELLAVLEGRKDAAGKDRGLFHRTGSATTVVAFQNMADQSGYLLSVSKKSGEQPPVRSQMLLSYAEAAVLRAILSAGIFFLSFHPDMVGALTAWPAAGMVAA